MIASCIVAVAIAVVDACFLCVCSLCLFDFVSFGLACSFVVRVDVVVVVDCRR